MRTPNIYEVAELFQEQTQTPSDNNVTKNKWKRTAYGPSFSVPKGERKRNEEKEMVSDGNAGTCVFPYVLALRYVQPEQEMWQELLRGHGRMPPLAD